jgi:hypothetical protein
MFRLKALPLTKIGLYRTPLCLTGETNIKILQDHVAAI